MDKGTNTKYTKPEGATRMIDVPLVSVVESKKLVQTFTDKQKADAMVTNSWIISLYFKN